MPGPKKSDSLSIAAAALAITAVALHILVNYMSPYGIHRDEFLYLAMGDHLQLWRMDFPPFLGVISNISRAWFGQSLAALRLLPAFAGGFLILFAVDAARRLGGKAFAQILTAVSMLASVLYLRAANLLQPVVFDELWWTIGMWCLIRWRQSGDKRWWIALGIVCGIGLFTKFSIVFFGFGVFVGLVATRDRTLLTTRWPWIAFALTVLIGLPSLVGQIVLGFPVMAQLDSLRSHQLVRISSLNFVSGQAFMLGLGVFVAVIGIVALIASKRFSNFRILGWTFIGSFAILILLQGKAYYLGPVYPVLIGAGAVIIENMVTGHASGVFRKAVIALIVLGGLATLPLGLPILPPPTMERYDHLLGTTSAVKSNEGVVLRLPQDYADMLGWEERVAELARIYKNLSPEERADAIIIAGNYGEAGAVDYYGPRHGLPHALCVSGSYWFFGPGDKPGKIAITIGCDEASLKRNWRSVTKISRLKDEWTVPEEQDLVFYLCGSQIRSVQTIWPSFAGRN
ncbi:MAG TPA: glycosyltransferase family 39 protein [Bacteroidota bacterium]|nr:glycosyltransferase family 39 protein [Bacteroidota bacterium]